MGGHAAGMGEMRTGYRILVRKLEEKRTFGRRGVDERIILKLIFK
jgi:hypothetical protein